MGKVHDRISDTNRQRKLRFGQATMLGVQFVDRYLGRGEYSRREWEFRIPEHLQPQASGYSCGYYRRRWEAVDAALRILGVVE